MKKPLKRGRRGRLLLFVLACCSVLSMIGITAAFFTDVISEESNRIKTAVLRFAYPDVEESNTEAEHGIIADMQAFDRHVLPYQEGEEILLSFESCLFGNTKAFAVPAFYPVVQNRQKGDKMTVVEVRGAEERKLASVEGEEEIGWLYGTLCEMEPGEREKLSYKLCIETLAEAENGRKPLRFSFDFKMLAAQQKNNEKLPESIRGSRWIAEEIQKKYEGKPAEINGFTDICGLERAVDQDGESLLDGAGNKREQVLVELVAEVSEEEEPLGISWYRQNAKEDVLIKTGTENHIALLLSDKAMQYGYRYEVKNRAGITVSPVFRFEREGEELRYETTNYQGDLSKR